MAYLMGIDLGTSSLKTIIVDEHGRVKALSRRSYNIDSPRGGYAEQNPEVWWQACCETVREAMHSSGIKDIAGVGFSGQMHGLVALDKDCKVVRPAILHCDTRSEKQVAELKDVFTAAGIQTLMMNPVYTGFLLPSLLWMKENEPRSFERIRYVCLPKDYLKLRMTGELSSDYSDASATLAFDIKNMRWSEEILKRTQLPADIFPKCLETAEKAGHVSAEASGSTGLPKQTVVVPGGGDQVMQGIGNGMVRVKDATVNIGSSGQVCFQIDRPVLNPALSTNMFCGYKRSRWILFGATMTAGLSLAWWNAITNENDFEKIDRETLALSPGGGVVFLPYLNGERTPHLDPNLSGAFVGVNINTTKARMTKAVMEGVAFSLRQCIDICAELGYEADSLVASGGGARSRAWLQIQSDIYNLPLRVTETEEQAGLGAAIAAGVGSGVYGCLEDGCAAAVHYRNEIVCPDKDRHSVYQDYYELYKEIHKDGRHVLNKAALLGRSDGQNETFSK